MGAISAASLIAIVLAVYIRHVVRASRLKKRVAERGKTRAAMTDEEFYSEVQPTSVARDGVLTVRSLIADAVRIPSTLIRPEDQIRELEAIGDLSHTSVIDYLVDVSSVQEPDDEGALLTVRDLIIKFGPELTKSPPR